MPSPEEILTRALALLLHDSDMRACPAAARLLSLLCLLPNGIAWDDLATLLPGEGREAARPLRRAGLAFDEHARLRVRASVREHARLLCPLSDEDEARALSLYLTRAAKCADEGAASARLLAEFDNIEVVIDRALAQGLNEEAVNALWGFARFSGGQGRVVDLLTKAAARSDSPRDRARCQTRLGEIALERSDHAAARACFIAAISLFYQSGDFTAALALSRQLNNIEPRSTLFIPLQPRNRSPVARWRRSTTRWKLSWLSAPPWVEPFYFPNYQRQDEIRLCRGGNIDVVVDSDPLPTALQQGTAK